MFFIYTLRDDTYAVILLCSYQAYYLVHLNSIYHGYSSYNNIFIVSM